VALRTHPTATRKTQTRIRPETRKIHTISNSCRGKPHQTIKLLADLCLNTHVLFGIQASLSNSQSNMSQSNDWLVESFSTIWTIAMPALVSDFWVLMRGGMDKARDCFIDSLVILITACTIYMYNRTCVHLLLLIFYQSTSYT